MWGLENVCVWRRVVVVKTFIFFQTPLPPCIHTITPTTPSPSFTLGGHWPQRRFGMYEGEKIQVLKSPDFS